uniref:Ig-like domain-containing protein n=1 Tax=Chelydra serpentina TaxID=8475 RepID=A0A8C3XR40_CHESE
IHPYAPPTAFLGLSCWVSLTAPSPNLPPSGLHSRHLLHTVVSEPGPGLPWYSRVAYVDDQVIFDYTSEKQRVEPRTAWMAQNEGPEFWDHQIFWARRWEAWFRASLNTLRELYNQTKVHYWSSHDGLTTLSCKVSGFYPRDITVTWLKNGESRQQDTYSEGILPSGDGTYQTWVTIEIDPKIKANYSCHVEHESLLEPLSVSWGKEFVFAEAGVSSGSVRPCPLWPCPFAVKFLC